MYNFDSVFRLDSWQLTMLKRILDDIREDIAEIERERLRKIEEERLAAEREEQRKRERAARMAELAAKRG